jgi:hypothetical protein
MKIGDIVIKGAEVLRIVESKSESYGEGPAMEYWVLEKAYATGRSGFMLHVPVERENDLLRPIPSKEEYEEMVATAKAAGSIPWIKDRMKRIDSYRAIVSSGDIAETLRLCMTFKEFRASEAGTLSTRDRDYETKSRDFVCAAGAAALGLEPDAVEKMLAEILG